MAARIPPNFRRVITAAAGGNVIEWYDFYIFGSLAAVLSVKFFEKSRLTGLNGETNSLKRKTSSATIVADVT